MKTRILLIILVLACTLSVEAKSKKKAKVEETPQLVLANDLDSLAYAYGVMFGNQYSNFQDSGVVVPEKVMNLDIFMEAFKTAIYRQNDKLIMPIETSQSYLQYFSEQMQARMEKERLQKLQKNKDEGAAYLAENAKKPNVQITPSGVQVEHIIEGTGAQPTSEDNVVCNYKGALINGKVFDENDYVDFNLSNLISGFREGICAMKEGGKAIVTIPSELGYGDRGAGKDIPGGSVLVFTIELLKVNPTGNE